MTRAKRKARGLGTKPSKVPREQIPDERIAAFAVGVRAKSARAFADALNRGCGVSKAAVIAGIPDRTGWRWSAVLRGPR